MNIEEQIAALETAFLPYPGAVAGTQLSRVLLDNSICKKHGIPLGRECRLVWCLGLGAVQCRKRFFYGLTIPDAIRAAQEEVNKKNSS